MPFEDVVVHQHTQDTTSDLFALCVKHFRETSPRVRFRFRCTKQKNEKRCSLSNNGTSITKLKRDGWNCVWVSDMPLDKQKSYFEVLFANRSRSGRFSGVFIGVTDYTTAIATDNYPIHLYENTIALFNSADGNRGGDSTDTIKIVRSAVTKTNDVIGVVVDRKQDKVIFYLNGVYVGEGLKKPSQFGPLYALVSIYFATEVISLVEKYDYRTLDDMAAFHQ